MARKKKRVAVFGTFWSRLIFLQDGNMPQLVKRDAKRLRKLEKQAKKSRPRVKPVAKTKTQKPRASKK